jgi:uncharacterized coiled-coil DUF342 family protein
MNAAELLASVEAAKQAVVDRIGELRRQRVDIDEELTALGAKRVRKKVEGKKRGRPAGSKNRPPLVPAPEVS